MRIQPPTHRKHARIEIIPLIDIMFFLLASFMMVSLDMTKIENIRVNVPSATQVQSDFGADLVHIAVDKDGKCWVEKQPIALPDLFTLLQNRFHQNAQLPVYIGGDADTRHGDMAAVLDLVRRAGIQKVAFTVTAEATPASAGAGG
ncbi:MAG: biopolymer transporter ExbD [Candidatus Brocadiia bacterium]|jgi:biopolymer transport protein ExbD